MEEINMKSTRTFWKSAGLAAVALFATTGAAYGALIDFDEIAAFTPAVAGDVVPVAGSVVTNQYQIDGVLFGKASVSVGVAVVRDTLLPSSTPNSVAGLDAAGLIPGSELGSTIGDIYFSFVVPNTSNPGIASSVSFTIGDGGGDVDVWQIRSYDLNDLLIDTQNISSEARTSVSINVAGIHRVEVDFTGNFGYSLDDLAFNTPTGAAVPVPGSLALLGLGLLGLGIIRRRRA
jgi:hypothetical protein